MYPTGDWSTKGLRRQFLDPHLGDFDGESLALVAHMIVEIDRSEPLLQLGLKHLAKRTGAGRVDVGFGTSRKRFFEGQAEVRVQEAPSVLGLRLPNTNPVLQRVWASRGPVAYDDALNHPLVSPLRDGFAAVQAKSMLAQRLQVNGQSFGIVCVDDVERGRTWSSRHRREVQQFCETFFAPLVAIHRSLQSPGGASRPSAAELEVIRQAAGGKTYKEVAFALGKSVRTVEAQMRKAREKTGAANLPELVRICEPWL